jgi:hypothetical protein
MINKRYAYYLGDGERRFQLYEWKEENGRYESPSANTADAVRIRYTRIPLEYGSTTSGVTETASTAVDLDESGTYANRTIIRLTTSGDPTTDWVANNYVKITGGDSNKFNGIWKIVHSTTSGGNYVHIDLPAEDIIGDLKGAEAIASISILNLEKPWMLTDEDSYINLAEYLAKGLVYYVKARLAEDRGEIELKEYFLKEFNRIVRKWEDSRIGKGIRQVSSGFHAIK